MSYGFRSFVRIASLRFGAWLFTACLVAPIAHAEAFKLRVVDSQGQPVQRFQVLLQSEPRPGWVPGVEGFTVLEANPMLDRPIQSLALAIRADGFASACAQYRGEELQKLLDGKAVVTLAKGNEVELKLRLPEGVAFPKDFVPEVYFDSWSARRSIDVAHGQPQPDAAVHCVALCRGSSGNGSVDIQSTSFGLG